MNIFRSTHILLTGIIVQASCFAQDTIPSIESPLVKQYRVQIAGMSGGLKKGWLQALSDTGIYYSRSQFGQGLQSFMPYREIRSFRLRGRNAIKNGAILGALAGAALTGILVASDYKKNEISDALAPKAGVVILGATFGALGGAAAGAFAAHLLQKRFIISGKRERYKKMIDDLRIKVHD
ncbi:MAG: hypothetical protein EOP49_12900 [Sphingobacteriales bacterium]|nr:MAG: hypothetical protein EOP49_12900 [Sphingobacteriales bacterium]